MLADEFDMLFVETSAKTNLNVKEAFSKLLCLCFETLKRLETLKREHPAAAVARLPLRHRGSSPSRPLACETPVLHMPRHAWMPDNAAPVCLGAGCAKKFTLLRRRHHCRFCGKVFCGACSRQRLMGRRMCAECGDKYTPVSVPKKQAVCGVVWGDTLAS